MSGFIYIWRDKKHNRFYIGSHWGDINDGYVCSSSWMKQAYKHRPTDFKRRIVSIISTCKSDLLKEEYRWLSMIKDSELGARYYNLNNHQNGHWMIDDDKTLSVKEKVSNTKKKFWASDESSILRKKVSEFHKKRGTRPASQKGRIPWNKGLTKDTDLRVLANAIAVSKPKANTDKMGRYERKKKLDE